MSAPKQEVQAGTPGLDLSVETTASPIMAKPSC